MWKKNTDGTYKNVTESIDNLMEGSVIITQVKFRIFTINSKYGVRLDLGPDIEIVSQRQPPVKQPLIKQPPMKRRRITRCTSPEEYIERYNGKMVDLLLKLTQSKLAEVPGWLTNPKNEHRIQLQLEYLSKTPRYGSESEAQGKRLLCIATTDLMTLHYCRQQYHTVLDIMTYFCACNPSRFAFVQQQSEMGVVHVNVDVKGICQTRP